MNDLFVLFEYNDREFEGIPKFQDEVEKNYHCQFRPIWQPAVSEGAESWITIFINSHISEFLTSFVINGLLWEMIKVGSNKYLFSPLFKSLEKLSKSNESNYRGVKILKLKLKFDDCDIYIGGLNKNFSPTIGTIFSEIVKLKPRFEREVNQKVIKIELPIEKILDQSDTIKYIFEAYSEDINIERFKKMWKITFTTNYPVMIYDFSNDALNNM